MSARSAPTRNEGGRLVSIVGVNVSEENGGEKVRLGVVAKEGLIHAVGVGDNVVVYTEWVVQTGVEPVPLVGDGDGRAARGRGDEKQHV